MGKDSAYLWEFCKWLHRRPISDNRRSPMNDEIPLDLSLKSTKTDANIKPSHDQDRDVNNMHGAATGLSTNSEGNKRWTLRHRHYAPGLIELMPKTGVYITKAELNHCLKCSRKCTELARFLTKCFFNKTALRKCLYIGSNHTPNNLQLDIDACAVIVDFVLAYGLIRHWHPSSDTSIKNAIRYQLSLSKKKY